MAGVGDVRDSSSPSPVETPDNPDGMTDRAAMEEEVSASKLHPTGEAYKYNILL